MNDSSVSLAPGDAPVIVWFRDDLRTADNPALHAAFTHNQPVIALYILDEDSPGIRPLGAAAKWWLHHSLTSLRSDLEKLNVNLILRRGPAAEELWQVLAETGANTVLWNRRYGGAERTLDAQLKKELVGAGLEAESFAANLLFEPWVIKTKKGMPYSVFTPFWRACTSGPPPRFPLPAPSPASAHPPAPSPRSASAPASTLTVSGLRLLPTSPDWAGGLRATWEPGERGAQNALDLFLKERLHTYREDRNVPAKPGTSSLSPHLRWGEISPYQVWHATMEAQRSHPELEEDARVFLSEIGWREFAWHTLFHFPALATQNWRADFSNDLWGPPNEDYLRAWRAGRTGFGLVDAGMRQLWRLGWMHNRVRMVTASFLTKNLLIDWRVGEEWFWDTLVDADLASNPFNWQWVAGTGADAAPYYRIFNPELQAKKFDPQEIYLRANIEEWGTPAYPQPVVDLKISRETALAFYQDAKV